MQTITVKIPDDMAKFLDKIAKEEERSRSYYIRKAISEYMEDMADLYVAKKRLAKKGRTYTLEEVARKNGISL
jgi:RHH-type rel operon transcriptional repressor/antitoxin RelB